MGVGLSGCLSPTMRQEARTIAPAGVPAHFDQACAEHDAEFEPAEQINNGERRLYAAGSEKDGKEACLEKNRFPPERIKCLACVDERDVEYTHQGPHKPVHPG